jgi:cyanophycin synthetase
MIRQGEMLGEAFDRVILYEDHYTRGRASGEIMRLFKQGLASAKRATETHEVQGAVKAVETALKMVRPGELLLVQADVIDETVNFIRQYLEKLATATEVSVVEALNGLHEAGVYAPQFATDSID